MPSQQQIQDTILSSQYKNALAMQANYNLINSGKTAQNSAYINYIWLNIDGLQYRFNAGDYTSSTTITIYDRLNQFIGFDTNINSLDPNAQIPGTTIVIVNPAGYQQPIDIGFNDFDPNSELPDGGRTSYPNSNWKGLNPQLWIISPAGAALFLGIDYVLKPSGGLDLLPGGNFPEIYPGATPTTKQLRATGYDKA